MSSETRFGKRIALPSTAEIKHELRMMAAGDALTSALAGSENRGLSPDQVSTIAAENGLSPAGTRLLVSRLCQV